LSEDNGAYVFSLPTSLQRAVPPAENFRVGATTAINAKPFSVASNESVSLLSAQGELAAPAGAGHALCDGGAAQRRRRCAQHRLRHSGHQRLRPRLSLGRSVLLDELKLTGLKDESAKERKRQAVQLPQLRRTG
jgi:hypothetical protein